MVGFEAHTSQMLSQQYEASTYFHKPHFNNTKSLPKSLEILTKAVPPLQMFRGKHNFCLDASATTQA
jgi:hypothetical protein